MAILDIPDGWKYVISSLVGGGIAIFVTFLNNRYQFKKDAKNWEKEKLWDGYQKCISNLNLIDSLWTNINIQYEVDYILTKENREKIFTLYSEIYPYFYWILYNHPNSKSEEIKKIKEIIEQEQEQVENTTKFKTKIKAKKLDFMIANPQLLTTLKQGFIQLMINDPRLHQKK